MAIDTLRDRMDATQRKRRLRMIEAGEFLPCSGGMAGLTLEGFSVYPRLLHECFEPTLVWVGVATCACQVLPVVTCGRFRGEIPGQLVAIAARNCHVASAESKRSLVVPAQAECGGQKPLQGVAILAAIEMGRDGELPGMFIGVAVGAALKFHLVKRCFAFRKVTLPAL